MPDQLPDAILLGLQQHDEDPNADDARFAEQAGQLDDDDCFDLDSDEGESEEQPVEEPPKPELPWSARKNLKTKLARKRGLLPLPSTEDAEPVQNVFCPTGPGGGVDATCSPGGGTAEVATQVTRAIYEKTGTASVTHGDIASHIAGLQHLSHSEVKQVAESIGVQPHHLGTKKKALNRIEAMMTARLGHAERGAAIGAVAHPVQNAFCPTGEGGGVDPSCSAGSKFAGERVGKAEHIHAARVEQAIAKAVGGEWEDDSASYDVLRGKDALEVKSLLKGKKDEISVHPDSLIRKVEYAANTGATFHTVVIDDRRTYEGGAHVEKYSGHRMYYKRGSGRYSLAEMHPVRNAEELRRLISTPPGSLPRKAMGDLPKGRELRELRRQAEATHQYRVEQNRKRRAEGRI